MTPGRVLVTGASGGQQGRTGRHVAEMLLARGIPVRAFVQHLSNLWRTLRGFAQQPRAFQVSDTIEALGGAKPKTFETFLREEKAALTLELARTA